MAEEDLFNTRLNKANELRAAGHNPFANDYSVDTTVATFVERYQGLNREQLEQETAIHHVAGRVLSVKRHGKASFLHIQDGSCDQSDPAGDSVGVLQIYLRKNNVGDTVYDEVFGRLDIGDIVGITGTAMRTKTDMLTLQAQSFRILTKSLRPLPDKWHGLSDQETRYRRRYVDLIVNSEVRNTFRKRSLVIRWLRDFFASRDFLEVETPMMHPIAGGAAARPFETHHNTLDLELYLRIAPELYLKRLVVGGFERVFEINRNFRNEGISTFHNPEFTMLEFYQSYTDYLGLMKIGEEMLSGVAQAVCGTTELTYGEHTISFAAPFKRMTMIEAIAVHGGPSAATVSDPTAARLALKEVGIELADDCSHGHLIVALFEYFAEEKLIQPTFIYDFPASVSPLSRLKDGDSTLVDRFELFAAGHELGNAFSELNDPIDQRQRFEAQLAAKAAGDDEAHEMDEDYIRALEHGMPPTGGFGLGIDRLVMLLTNSSSIRDVILFPQLRSRKGADPDSTVPDSTEQGKTTEGHE